MQLKTLLILLLVQLIAFQLSAQDYKKVQAKNGDGIYSLLRRYSLNPSEYLDDFVALNKKNLGKNNELLKGKTYLLPVTENPSITKSSGETGVFPIFGKKYKNIEFKDNVLQGAIFYVIAGHGGPDPGAMGKRNGHQMCEDEYAYDISLRLARNLLEHNATVYIITRDPNDGIRDEMYLKCDKDEYVYGDLKIPLNQVKRLKQRTTAVNKISKKYTGRYERLIELHVDSRYQKQKVDIFFYHYTGSKKGKALCETLYQTVKKKYAEVQPNRGYQGTIKARKLYTLRYANPVSTYIELGNINHQRDQKRLVVEDNRQAIANWLTLGLIKDYKNSK
jgi:N-acetylmuramoyl-L-alanine amidase